MSDDSFFLTFRRQAETTPGSGEWRVDEWTHEYAAARTAILLCDVWDDHWCKNAARR